MPESIQMQDSKYFVLNNFGKWIKPRHKFAHKGDFGHVLLIAGSKGMMGASILAAKACMRTGAGLLTAHIPKIGNIIMQTAVPEVMTSLDESSNCFSKAPDIDKYTALAIGPGLGQSFKTQRAILEVLEKIISCGKNDFAGKVVLDADALNILSINNKWLEILPSHSILTPHPKEFDRLFGSSANCYVRHLKQIEMAKKYSVCIVLKCANTSIVTPAGECFFNVSGNPGMATAGSGDVLTGMIASLLAQGYSPKEAACAGVAIHGIAGDIAALKSKEAVIARDIIKNIGRAIVNSQKL